MKISLCIPMYNENKIIEDTALAAYKYMSEHFGSDFEIIFSNDGSTDGCDKTVEALELPNIRVVGYEKNQGKGCAVKTAVLASSGDIVVFTDADLAYGLDVIAQACEVFEKEECGAVVGSRPLHKDGYAGYTAIRKLASKTYIKVLGLLGGLRLSDSQCGFKAFRGDLARRIFTYCQINGFAFDLEAILIGEKMKIGFFEMPVKIINHRESKVSVFSDAFKMMKDARAINKRIKKLDIK